MQTTPFMVPDGACFPVSDLQSASNYISNNRLFPVVLKAPNLAHGNFVFPNINDRQTLESVWSNVKDDAQVSELIVEQHFEDAEDYRFLVMSNHETVVIKRTPASVTGDGKQSIQELIDEENYRRMNPRNTRLCEIYIKDKDEARAINDQGYTFIFSA